MATTVISPPWDLSISRNIVRNNAPIRRVKCIVHTNEKWLPKVLVGASFFPSNSEVKRQKPEFWRELKCSETIELSWAEIFIVCHVKGTGRSMERGNTQ
jgi:hypothetical protein